MDAEISRDGDVTVIHLHGQINYESTEPFRRHLNRFVNEKIVFNLQSLHFVGSSGITVFVDMLREFAALTSVRPKFAGVGSEFRKIFAASQMAPLEIFDTAVTATLSWRDPAIQPLFFLAPRLNAEFGEDPAWIEDEESADDALPEDGSSPV